MGPDNAMLLTELVLTTMGLGGDCMTCLRAHPMDEVDRHLHPPLRVKSE
jgi:hypothetical protein